MWDGKKIICGRGIELSDGIKGKKKQNCPIYARKVAVIKQIKLASAAEDRKKLLEEKLKTSEGKFSVPKILNAWTYDFANFPEFSFGVCMQPGLSCLYVII